VIDHPGTDDDVERGVTEFRPQVANLQAWPVLNLTIVIAQQLACKQELRVALGVHRQDARRAQRAAAEGDDAVLGADVQYRSAQA
jgi:hypothetical protein